MALIQSFGDSALHSERLFLDIYNRILEFSNNLTSNIKPDDVANLVWAVQNEGKLLQGATPLETLETELLEASKKMESYETLSKLYFSLVRGFRESTELKKRVRERLFPEVYDRSLKEQAFLLWTLCMDHELDRAGELFKLVIKQNQKFKTL